MTDKQPEALQLADDRPSSVNDDLYQWASDAEDELRRLHEANEAFGKRQEWWNERMFELEKQRDELLEALKEIVDASDADEWNGVSTMKARAAIAKAEGKQ